MRMATTTAGGLTYDRAGDDVGKGLLVVLKRRQEGEATKNPLQIQEVVCSARPEEERTMIRMRLPIVIRRIRKGEHGSGKRYLAHEIHQERTKSGPYILLDGRSVTHAEIQAVLFGKHRDLAHSLTGHDPAKLSNYATLCIANVDALVPHEQDLVATFLQKHRKEHAGMRVILLCETVRKKICRTL